MKMIIHLMVQVCYYLLKIRFVLHYMAFVLNKKVLYDDFVVWKRNVGREQKSDEAVFFYLMDEMPEYRNIFYTRLGYDSKLISWLAPEVSTLHINCQKIGKGFYINHGHSTEVNAKEIGEMFQVWHGVTVGVKTQFDDNTKPTIGNNVRICSGACVCGDIHIGDNVTIGANSVVMKSVPDGCVVVGNPAYIISKNGEKCHEKL